MFFLIIFFVENTEMPSGVDYEIKTEPNDSSGRETVKQGQETVKELQDATQSGIG